MLVTDNDSATNRPIGSASFHTLMRGEKMPAMQSEDRNSGVVLYPGLRQICWHGAPTEIAWGPAPNNTSSLMVAS